MRRIVEDKNPTVLTVGVCQTLYNLDKDVKCSFFEKLTLADMWKRNLNGTALRNMLKLWEGDRVALVGKDTWDDYADFLKIYGVTHDPWKSKDIDMVIANSDTYIVQQDAYIKEGDSCLMRVFDEEPVKIDRVDPLPLLMMIGNDEYQPDFISEYFLGAWAFKPLHFANTEPEGYNLSKHFDPDGWYINMSDEEIISRIAETDEKMPKEGYDSMDFLDFIGELNDDDE